MNKILIVTAYSGNNFGSSLQAFALKEYLKKLGFSPSFIHVKETKIKKWNIFLTRLLTGLTNFRLLKKEIKTKLTKHSNRSVFNARDFFEKDYLDVLEIKRRDLKKLAFSDDIKFCIVGSDQIWNPEDAYLDSNIFLKFSPKQKNIAYAVSFGQNYIYKYNINKFKRGLRNIRLISCREQSGCSLCEKLGFPSVETIDPTLLFNKTEWFSFFKLNEQCDSRMLILYFIGPIDERIRDQISIFAKKFDKAVLLTKYDQKILGVETVNASVVDFVSYFGKASFVVTDSFHGTIFSINFSVPFYTVPRVYLNADGDNNERVLNILKKLSLQNRLLDFSKCDLFIEPKDIDYKNVKPVLEELRRKSINFIKDSLKIN